MDNDKKERFVIGLEAYVKAMNDAGPNKEMFHILLSSLIYEGLQFLMGEVELEELENIYYDIEHFMDSLDELSKEQFNKMFYGELK